MSIRDLPRFDDDGNNLADPNDRQGWKSAYIQALHEQAVRLHVGRGTGLALDLGCGYGRMSRLLSSLGYGLFGLEPSMRVLRAVPDRSRYLGLCNGALLNIPFQDQSFDLVCLFGVARMVHLLGRSEVCDVVPRLVRSGGRLVVIDNLRANDERYLSEEWFDETFAGNGMRLVHKVPIRASRWPIIYMIRYGLIPARWFNALAKWELARMARKTRVPRLSYYNYLFIYERL